MPQYEVEITRRIVASRTVKIAAKDEDAALAKVRQLAGVGHYGLYAQRMAVPDGWDVSADDIDCQPR